MTPTFETSVTMDANTKGGVGVRRRKDTAFGLGHIEFQKMLVGQLRGYVQTVTGYWNMELGGEIKTEE